MKPWEIAAALRERETELKPRSPGAVPLQGRELAPSYAALWERLVAGAFDGGSEEG